MRLEPEDFLTLREVAARARVHPSTVWRWRRELGAERLFGTWRVPLASWERFRRRGRLQAMKVRAPDPPPGFPFIDDMELARRQVLHERRKEAQQ